MPAAKDRHSQVATPNSGGFFSSLLTFTLTLSSHGDHKVSSWAQRGELTQDHRATKEENLELMTSGFEVYQLPTTAQVKDAEQGEAGVCYATPSEVTSSSSLVDPLLNWSRVTVPYAI